MYSTRFFEMKLITKKNAHVRAQVEVVSSPEYEFNTVQIKY